MIRLLILVISIGLADSINPSTIGPGLFLAAGDKPRSSVAEFTLSIFVVSLAAGALIALGPGQLIRNAVPNLDVIPSEVDLAAAEIAVARGEQYLQRFQIALKPFS